MRIYQSRFHPKLDDPGAWDAWRLDPNERAELQALLKDAGIGAAHALVEQYGSQATLFDSPGFAKRLAGQPLADDALFHIALTVLAYDGYRSRVPVPRPAAGGGTNPANRRHWAVLRTHLLERLQDVFEKNARDALLARGIYARVPQDGLPTGQIARRLRRQVDETGMFRDAELSLELRPELAGGPRWLQAETVRGLHEIERKLRDGEPVLVELLRDPEASPAAAQFVVVYRLEESDEGWIGLSCYDASAGTQPLGLRLRSEPDKLIIYDVASNPERPAVKGIRLLRLDKATPPRFGMRRYTRWVFPWSWVWQLKRRWRRPPAKPVASSGAC